MTRAVWIGQKEQGTGTRSGAFNNQPGGRDFTSRAIKEFRQILQATVQRCFKKGQGWTWAGVQIGGVGGGQARTDSGMLEGRQI